LVIKTGGCGGFLASVRDIGAEGQQQHPGAVSAEEAVLGGAGGFFMSRGGGTKPRAPVPSLANKTPLHSVAANAELTTLFVCGFFIMSVFLVFPCFNKLQEYYES